MYRARNYLSTMSMRKLCYSYILDFRCTSRRMTDFTAALTPRGLVFCNDFWMPFGCVGEHSRCCVDIHVVICSGYDNIFVTFNFYLH